MRERWPSGAAGRVLLALLVVGVLLRVLAAIGSWPTLSTLEDGYQIYAKAGPFLDPLHPAGYALLIGALGALTRQIVVLILLQHLAGIASAFFFYAAVRRVTRSDWPGLLPAGMILLGADQIFLEHVVMSESWEVLAMSAGFYAAARAFDEPLPWWRWPLLTGVLLSVAAMLRTAAVLLIVVAVVAILLYGQPGQRGWGWRPALAAAAAAAALLFVFAGANDAYGPRFGIAPSPGWHLYGMAAQFADCRQFTPAAGTKVLCETSPSSQRQGANYYMYDPHSPAVRYFGSIGIHDSVVGGWARRAVLSQFGDFLGTAWLYLRTYYVPGSLPARLRATNGSLDPQVDFTFTNPFYRDAIKSALEQFFDRFSVHTNHWALRFLHDWQRVFRFGATALFVTTILTLIGLFVGTRRSRLGVLLFGLGGLSLLVSPALGGTYSGRYTIPMAAPLMAAAALNITAAYRASRSPARRPDS